MSYTIIGQAGCTYCDKATGMLDALDLPYLYFNISDSPWLKTLIVKAGHSTVPIIFDAQGKDLGGYSDLLLLLKGTTDAS